MNPDKPEIESSEQYYPTLAGGIQQSPDDITIQSGVALDNLPIIRQPISSREDNQGGRLVSSQSGADINTTQTVDATVLSVDTHLMPIMEAIWDARAKWRNIGRMLKLTEGDIDAIHDRDDGEYLHTVLCQWMHTGGATTHELLKVLKSKIIDRSDIAKEILSLEGDKRVQVGLKDDMSSECAEVCLSLVERMELALSGELTLDDVKDLPVDSVWYQLGLWLGVEENTLDDIISEDNYSYSVPTVNEYLEGQLYSSNDSISEEESEISIEYDDEQVLPSICMFQVFIENTLETDKELLIDSLTGKQKFLFKLLSEGNRFEAVKWSQLLAEMTDNNRKIACKILKQKWLKRVKIVESLVKVGCRNIAERICTERGVSLTEYLEATDPASNPPEYIIRYSSYLKHIYLQHFVYNSEDEWPPVTSEKHFFSNLALISTQRYASEKEIESMKHDYAHGGVDTIVAHKRHIELNEVFFPIISPDNNASRLTILMDGAPGVGKTTIARKFCLEWAKGDILQEYHLVLFVSLREASDDSIASLLPSPIDETKKVIEYLGKLHVCGKYTLFILDGYDELSAENRSKQSIFMKLIGGKVLHNCSVLVTSRPYSSGVLKGLPRVNRHVEVLGFTTDQRNDYIGKSLIQPDVANRLIHMLNERLDIASLCYTPLNCRIILFVFEQKNYELPVTLTELYEIFILHTIKRFQTKFEVSSHLIENVHSLNELPETILKQLNSLSEVAYECLMKDQLFITSNDVDIVSTLSLGLLSSLKSINLRGVTNNYQFLHLTIQEFLAARCIFFFAAEHKLSFIREHIGNNRLRLTLLFLAGLTKLKFITPENSLLKDNKKVIFKKIHRVNAPKTYLESNNSDDDKWSEYYFIKPKPEIIELRKQQKRFFFLAQLAFESQTILNNILEFNVFDLSGFQLSSFDSFVVAHFLSSTSSDYVLSLIDFTECGLPSNSILYRKQHYISGQPAVRKTTSLNVDQIDSRLLMDILKGCTILTHISVHFNDDSLDHDTVCLLTTAINTTKSLRVLKLSHLHGDLILKTSVCLGHVTSQLCPSSLSQLLKFVDPKQIEQLIFSENPNLFNCCSCSCKEYNVCEELCSTLTICNEIQKVQFYNCGVTDRIVEKLGPVLYDKKQLVELNLDENDLYKFGSVLRLLENGVSIKIGGIHLVTQDSLTYLESHISENNLLINSLILPKNLMWLRCDIDCVDENLAATIITVNQHLDFAGFGRYGYGGTCKLVEAITNHKSLTSFNGFGIDMSDTTFRLESITCPHCLNMMINTQDPTKLETISLTECSLNGCEKVLEKCCSLIASTQVMKKLELCDSTFNEKSINSVISSIETCCAERLKVISINGTIIGGESIRKLLQFMVCHQNIKLHVFDYTLVKVENEMVEITYLLSTKEEVYELVTSLLFPTEITQLKVVDEYSTYASRVSANALTKLILNNPQLVDIYLSNLSFSGCDEIVQLAEVLRIQKFLEKVTFKCNGVSQIISQTMLCVTNINPMCPRMLSNLFHFLSPGRVTVLDFSNSCIFSKFGSSCDCEISWDLSLEVFLEVLTQSLNIEMVDFSYCHLPEQTVDRIMLKLVDKLKLKEVKLLEYELTISIQSFELIFRKMIFENTTLLDLYTLKLRVGNNSELAVSCSVDAERYIWSILKILSHSKNTISSVSVSFHGFSDNDITAFKQILLELEVLNLSKSRLSHNFLKSLACFIAANGSLRELHLNSTELTGPSAISLLNKLGPAKESLEVLNLSDNLLYKNCSDEQLGLAIQKFFQQNQSIKTLSLSNCGLNGTVAIHIANGLERNIILQELDLSIPNLSNKPEQFAQAVNKILAKNKSLTKLNISSCFIVNDSLLHLADVLQKNFTLKELYMDSIKPDFLHLADDIVLRKLKAFYMDSHFSNVWISFFTSLKDNSSLHTLSLCDIWFTEEALKALAEFLRASKCMKSLRLDHFYQQTKEIKTLQADLPSINITFTYN